MLDEMSSPMPFSTSFQRNLIVICIFASIRYSGSGMSSGKRWRTMDDGSDYIHEYRETVLRKLQKITYVPLHWLIIEYLYLYMNDEVKNLAGHTSEKFCVLSKSMKSIT